MPNQVIHFLPTHQVVDCHVPGVLSEIRLNSLGVRILNVVPGGKINNLGQERDVGDKKGQEGLGKDMEGYGGIGRDRRDREGQGEDEEKTKRRQRA